MTSPEMPREIRLAELLEMGVPVAWPEAVAIIGVLAVSALRQLPPISLPALEQIVIDTNGHVIAEGSQIVGNNGVPALRLILGALLKTAHPPAELVALADDSGEFEHIDDLEKFTYDLTFFARPDDTVEVASLAERALSYVDSHHRDEAFESLTRKARETSAALPAAPTSPDARISSTRAYSATLGAVVVVLVGMGLAWQLSGSSRAADKPAAATVTELARRVQAEVTEKVTTLQGQLGRSATGATPVGRDRTLVASPRRGALPRASDNDAPLTARDDGPAASVAGRTRDDLDAGAAALGTGVDGAGALPTPDLHLYSADDFGVVAPRLVRPQMPAVRIEGLTQEAAGDLELLIGQDGRVEQARLVPVSQRFQDRMMVSAAKTWQFDPAIRDGRPVRYLLRIPITW